MRPVSSPVASPVAPDGDPDNSTVVEKKWSPKQLLQRAERSHNRVPLLRKIPFRSLAIILFIALLNAIVWVAAGIVLVRLSSYPATTV